MLEISRCCPCVGRIVLLVFWRLQAYISITPVLTKVFEEIVGGTLNHCLEGNRLLPSS